MRNVFIVSESGKGAGRGSSPASRANLEKGRGKRPPVPGVSLSGQGVRVRMPDEASRAALLAYLEGVGPGGSAAALGKLLALGLAARLAGEDSTG